MRKKQTLTAASATLLLCLAMLAAGQTRLKEADLPERYREWLKLVSYIILPAEREVFLSLSGDRERDIFVEAFWKQRDPTPETPENEFREEHLRRFKYANSNLGRNTPREGWMTDQGRVYILLGKPTSIERFEGVAGIHPCQVWYYYGDTSKGLPSFFGLVFYQRGGGEFKLYNPASDGPASLIIDTRGLDLTDHVKVYEKIRELAPTLAAVSVSLIPGQLPYGLAPSPENTLLLTNILESAKKAVSPAYATHFRNYIGLVSTDYLTNYVESTGAAAVFRDPELGLDFLHFAVSPQKLSVEYYGPKDQYYAGIKVSVSLRHKGQLVYQSTKDFPFYFPPDREAEVRASGVAFLDLLPVPAGKYSLTVLLQNSSGKEFSLLEREVENPAAKAGEKPRFASPVFGFKLESGGASGTGSFKVGGTRFSPELKSTVGREEQAAFMAGLVNAGADLRTQGRVEAVVERAESRGSPVRTFSWPLAGFPAGEIMCVGGSFPTSELEPGYYEMRLTVKDEAEAELDSAVIPFAVAAEPRVPHPITISRSLPAANAFLHFYALAYEYDRLGDVERSLSLYERAYNLQPTYPEGRLDFAGALIRAGRFDRALDLVESFKNDSRFGFDHFLLKGLALLGKKEFARARDSLLQANALYNSDVRVLNALGRSYIGTGQRKEALEALRSSLRLQPAQAEVAALVAELEKNLR